MERWESVRAKYAKTAIRLRDEGSCCDSSSVADRMPSVGPIAKRNTQSGSAELGLSLGASLGCGTRAPQLHAGEIDARSLQRSWPRRAAFGATGFACGTPTASTCGRDLSLANETRPVRASRTRPSQEARSRPFPRRRGGRRRHLHCASTRRRQDGGDERGVPRAQARRTLRRLGHGRGGALPAQVKSAMDAWAGSVRYHPVDEYRARWSRPALPRSRSRSPTPTVLVRPAAGGQEKIARPSSVPKSELILGSLVSHEKRVCASGKLLPQQVPRLKECPGSGP